MHGMKTKMRILIMLNMRKRQKTHLGMSGKKLEQLLGQKSIHFTNTEVIKLQHNRRRKSQKMLMTLHILIEQIHGMNSRMMILIERNIQTKPLKDMTT